MAILPSAIKLGMMFIDDGLQTLPEEYRIHKIIRISTQSMTAIHISSTNERTFDLEHGLDNLIPVPTEPELVSNADCLVDSLVVISLVNSCVVRGKVTGIRYNRVTIDWHGQNESHRQIRSIELDKSSQTCYLWSEITSIKVISG